MYKNEYLSRLRKALKGVDSEDADRLIEYYREIIEDGFENGGGEKFIDSLEPPELVAQNYIKEMGKTEFTDEEDHDADCVKPIKQHNGDGKSSETPTFVKVILMIACVIFAFAGAVAIFSVCVIAFSFAAYGIAIFIMSFGLLSAHTGAAFAQMGYAIVLISVGAAIGYILPFICRAYRYVILLLSSRKSNNGLKFHGTKRVGFLLGGLFAAGILVFLISFGSLGFSGEKLACADDMVLREQTIEATDALLLESDNMGLEIKHSTDGSIKLEYYDFEDEQKSFFNETGNAKLYTNDGLFGSFKHIWKRGVFFANYSSKYHRATLYLPAGSDFDLSIDIKNGAISIKDMEFDNLSFITKNGAISMDNISANNVKLVTSNGAVRIKDVKVLNDVVAKSNNGAVMMINVHSATLTCETSNGVVKFDRCVATNIYGKTSNGALSVTHIKGDMIELYTSNGSITGTIEGKKSDYKIESYVGDGSNNLSNKEDGSKTLKARTSNGVIKINFTE